MSLIDKVKQYDRAAKPGDQKKLMDELRKLNTRELGAVLQKARKLSGADALQQAKIILTIKPKSIEIKQPLSTLGKKEIDFIKAQFPKATAEEMAAANTPKRERKSYEHFTRDGEGPERKVDPKPKTGLYRTKSEGRIKGVMPTKKEPKLKLEVWNANTMMHFFRTTDDGIHADRTQGWFITFNTPARKMTIDDQLHLFLAHGETEYEVQISRSAKHLIIDSLEGNPPA